MDLLAFLCETQTAAHGVPHTMSINTAFAPPAEADLTTEELLLLILPPSSCDLLVNNRHAQIHSDSLLGCKHMFPTSFRCMDYLKMVPWTREPVLPPVSVSCIRAAVRAMRGIDASATESQSVSQAELVQLAG
jgi:hypothetical protein